MAISRLMALCAALFFAFTAFSAPALAEKPVSLQNAGDTAGGFELRRISGYPIASIWPKGVGNVGSINTPMYSNNKRKVVWPIVCLGRCPPWQVAGGLDAGLISYPVPVKAVIVPKPVSAPYKAIIVQENGKQCPFDYKNLNAAALRKCLEPSVQKWIIPNI